MATDQTPLEDIVMKKICECGRAIVVFTKRKGYTSAPDKDHDLCDRCWRSLRNSIKF